MLLFRPETRAAPASRDTRSTSRSQVINPGIDFKIFIWSFCIQFWASLARHATAPRGHRLRAARLSDPGPAPCFIKKKKTIQIYIMSCFRRPVPI